MAEKEEKDKSGSPRNKWSKSRNNSKSREEHSLDQCRPRLNLSENFERHWSIRISGEIRMDQSLVHTFSWGNSYGPMVLKVLLKFPPTLALVHGWLFPEKNEKGKAGTGESNRETLLPPPPFEPPQPPAVDLKVPIAKVAAFITLRTYITAVAALARRLCDKPTPGWFTCGLLLRYSFTALSSETLQWREPNEVFFFLCDQQEYKMSLVLDTNESVLRKA